MSRTRSLSQMTTDIRNRTNCESSLFVTDDEIAEYINQELAELHRRLTMGEGQVHLRSMASIAVSPTASPSGLYSLPDDYWRLQSITASVGGWVRNLTPFMESERGQLQNLPLAGSYPYCLDGVKYRLQASYIELLPAVAAFTCSLFYTPAAVRLTSPSQSWDGYNGYELAPIYGACAHIRAKQEKDAGYFLGLKAALYEQIETLAAQRDAANPERVQDVVGYGTPW